MRLSIFAMPALDRVSAQKPAPDGRMLRSRFALADSGFDVADLDPTRDLAEQVEALLVSQSVGPRDHVMLYAACPALLSVEEELFLCLDPKNPTMGDCVADVAAALCEGAQGPKLIVLDLVDTKASIDKPRSEAFVRAALRAVLPDSSGIELVLAVRPKGALASSPFVEAVLAAVDALPPGRGLTTRGIFERIERKLAAELPCLFHGRVKVAFEVVPLRVGKRDSGAGMPKVPPPAALPAIAAPSLTPSLTSETAAVAPMLPPAPPEAVVPSKNPSTVPPPARKPAGLPSFRPPPTDSLDLGWNEDDFGLSAPPIAPARVFSAPPGASLPPPPSGMYGGATITGSDGPISGPRSGPISARSISPFARHTIEGELLSSQGDLDGAIAAFRRALSVLGPAGDPDSRAEMYARIGEIRMSQGENDGAISDFEKALALRPGHVPALESLLVLCAAEKDWRGVMSAEERLLAALPSDTMRFERLIEFASRWEGIAEKPQRAKVLFERANVLRPNDPIVTTQIRRITNKSFFPPKA